MTVSFWLAASQCHAAAMVSWHKGVPEVPDAGRGKVNKTRDAAIGDSMLAPVLHKPRRSREKKRCHYSLVLSGTHALTFLFCIDICTIPWFSRAREKRMKIFPARRRGGLPRTAVRVIQPNDVVRSRQITKLAWDRDFHGKGCEGDPVWHLDPLVKTMLPCRH